MTCKLCNSTQTKKLFESNNIHGRFILSSDTFQVYKCSNCGVMFLDDIEVNSSYYSKYYFPEYYETKFHNAFINKIINLIINISIIFKENQILRNYHNIANNKLKILDIGCGNGEFLSRISNTKFEKFGIEINTEGYELCKGKNLKVFNKELKDLKFQDNFFDVVTLWHVIEHLENPIDTIKSVKRVLKEDGILVIAVPNTDSLGFKYGQNFWFHLDSPRHLMLFNKKSLKYLLNNAGFRIILKKNLFYDYPLDLFWSVRNSKMKFIIYLLYPYIKYLSNETNLIMCEKL